METQEKIRQFRQEMHNKLREWIPNNDQLVAKELQIFDKAMNRREFLKTTSLALASLLFYQGCSDRPPSQWDVPDSEALSETELMSVTKTSKIVIDADVLDSAIQYSPIEAFSSSDANFIKNSSTLEAFNPHVMTVDSIVPFEGNTLKLPDRTYGSSEIIHLCQESESEDYFLDIYSSVLNTGQDSLHSTKILLSDSANINYDKFITANGTYHNKVVHSVIYSQKMIATSNIYNSNNPDIRIYYQTDSFDLREPIRILRDNFEWEYLDLIEQFRDAENYSFSKYSIVDMDKYNDGEGNSFIYGTLQFDDLYSYGFVVAYKSITSFRPTVTFFTPKFLSVYTSGISNLKNSFDRLDIDSNGTVLEDFTLFKGQKFLPFTANIFSFVCFDVDNAEVNEDNNKYDLTLFTQTYNSMIKRYLVSVDATKGGVTYLLEGYDNSPSLSVENNSFHFSFKSDDSNFTDLYRDIYRSEAYLFSNISIEINNTYIRYVREDGDTIHILFASLYKNSIYENMGISHISVKLDTNTLNVTELLQSISDFEVSKYERSSYHDIWFDTLVAPTYLYAPKSLYLSAGENYKSFITQNQYGVLKSYFIINIKDSELLLSFNEQGENPETTVEQAYNSQSFDNLYTQIQNYETNFFPPIPIATDVNSVYLNNTIGSEEDLVYSATRTKNIDSSKQILVENEDTSLKSYYYSSFDSINGTWSSQELTAQVDVSDINKHMYKEARHVVHMNVNSIYNYPSKLEDTVYVEVRLIKAAVLSDITNLETPITYHAKRDVSIFLKPDKTGRISLEIKNGISRYEIFNGSTILYRLVDTNDFIVDADRPIALVSSSSTTTSTFKHFNISAKLIKRLATENADTFQAGVLDSDVEDPKTAYTIFHEHVISGEEDNIVKITDGYSRLAQATLPDNDTNFTSLALLNANEPATIINPLLFVSKIQIDDSLSFGGIHISRWIHSVIASIKHAVHKAVKSISEKIKDILESLVPSIEDLFSNSLLSLENILNSLMVIVNKIILFADELYVLYFEPFWGFIKGFFDFKSAFIMGQEFKNIFSEQMLPNSQSENAYSIIKDQTAFLQKQVSIISQNVKKDIDERIENQFYKYDTKADGISRDVHSSASSSVKYHHSINSVFKVYNDVVSNKTPDKPMDTSDFTCNSDFGVEQLFSCILNKENKEIADILKNKYESSNKTLNNIATNRAVGSDKEKMTSLLKESIKIAVDEIDIIADGVIQIPLAFLNGSCKISLAEKELDVDLAKVCEIVGLLFFDDSKKFKSLDDIGYFISSYGVLFQLNTMDPRVSLVEEVQEKDVNIVKYIKSGNFRLDVSNLATDIEANALSNLIAVCEVLDTTEVIFEAVIDLFIDNLSVSKFNLMQKLIVFSFTFRMFLRVPKIVKHCQFGGESASEQISKGFSLIADFFHMSTLIIEIYKQSLYSYEYIEDGVEGDSIYGGLCVLDAMLVFLEGFCELSAVIIYGSSDENKHESEEMNKSFHLLAAIPHALLDFFSGNSEEENALSGVRVLKYLSYTILIFSYGSIGLITLQYMKEE